MTERVKVTLDVTADVKDGYGPHELADVVKFYLNQSELNDVEADISAIDIVGVREAHREIQSDGLAEAPARRAEIELMCGRLNALTKDSHLTTEERIGACKALRVLEIRRADLETRKEKP